MYGTENTARAMARGLPPERLERMRELGVDASLENLTCHYVLIIEMVRDHGLRDISLDMIEAEIVHLRRCGALDKIERLQEMHRIFHLLMGDQYTPKES